MTATAVGIRASGLRELRTAFRKSGDKSFDRHISKVHRRIATRVVSAAKPGIAAESSTTAGAVSAITSAAGAKIRINREQAPQAGGVIFGAIRTKRRVGPSGRQWVGYRQFQQFIQGEAYHIFPELDAMHDEIADDYLKEIDDFYGEQGVPQK